MLRHSRLGLCIAASLAVAACGKKNEEPKQEPPAAPAPAKVVGLDAIPRDARVVVGIDVAALAGSELVARGVRAVFARDPGLERRIQALLTACGLQVPRDLESLLIATGDTPAEAVMVATGAFDERRLPKCIAAAVAESGGSLEQKATEPRAVWATETATHTPVVWFAFGGPRTVVAAASEPWLTAALGDGPKLAANRELMAIVERADRKAALWAAGRVDPRVGGRLANLTGGAVSEPVQYMFAYLRLSVADGLRAELAAVMASPEDAAATAEFARSQLGPYAMVAQGVGLGPLVSNIVIEAENDTVFLRLHLSPSRLKEVISQIDTAAGRE